jgi:predicted nucleic acid-binding Zn ribbon protein
MRTPEVNKGVKAGTHCKYDGKVIEVMAFKGTGFCSENCRKDFHKETTTGGARH